MAELPPANNVFGYLHSAVGLQPVLEALQSRLGLSAAEARVTRSEDGIQTLQIETSACRLLTHVAQKVDTWPFDGAVAGSLDEIFDTLLPIVQALTWAGFRAHFEIYDASFQFVGACPRVAAGS